MAFRAGDLLAFGVPQDPERLAGGCEEGSSGSAVLNADGELVGIVVSGDLGTHDNEAFAIHQRHNVRSLCFVEPVSQATVTEYTAALGPEADTQ
ncbi:MAG: hypothetical protein ACRD0Q_06850 [Acidimicrobiales bacterium]